MSKLTKASFVLFFALMLGNITHIINSDLFVMGMLVLVGMLGVEFYNSRLSPAAKAKKAQANAVRNASLVTPLLNNQGILFIYRENSALGAGLAYAGPDALALVDLRPMSFARWILPAGDHSLRAGVKGTNASADNIGGEAAFTLAAGEQVFFRLSMAMNLKKFTVGLHRETDAATV